jgi:LmbE family N-acetylglucosaminyl deacetylase
MFDPKTILVLAPHTDDGELGCGGAIARLAEEGKDIHYAAFSTCAKSLPAGLAPDTLVHECRKATSLLGIPEKNVTLFDFEVRLFSAVRQEILEELVTLNKKIKPGLVLIPSAPDIHQDHQVIHKEAIRAFKNTSLIGYELPWNQTSFSCDFFVRLTKKQLTKKTQALKAYQSQSHRNYMASNFIESLATVRGVQANCEYAEAFEVYKIFT